MENEHDLPVEQMPEPQVEKTTEPKEWRPTDNEALREHEVSFRFLSRGCIVRVGCKEIAFEKVEDAMEAINAYVANPWEEQKKWRKILD